MKTLILKMLEKLGTEFLLQIVLPFIADLLKSRQDNDMHDDAEVIKNVAKRTNIK